MNDQSPLDKLKSLVERDRAAGKNGRAPVPPGTAARTFLQGAAQHLTETANTASLEDLEVLYRRFEPELRDYLIEAGLTTLRKRRVMMADAQASKDREIGEVIDELAELREDPFGTFEVFGKPSFGNDTTVFEDPGVDTIAIMDDSDATGSD